MQAPAPAHSSRGPLRGQGGLPGSEAVPAQAPAGRLLPPWPRSPAQLGGTSRGRRWYSHWADSSRCLGDPRLEAAQTGGAPGHRVLASAEELAPSPAAAGLQGATPRQTRSSTGASRPAPRAPVRSRARLLVPLAPRLLGPALVSALSLALPVLPSPGSPRVLGTPRPTLPPALPSSTRQAGSLRSRLHRAEVRISGGGWRKGGASF